MLVAIMMGFMDDRDLLALEAATIFELTESGRILRRNSPDQETGPRLRLAGCSSGNLVLIRHDVSERTAQAITALAADEPPLRADSAPVRLDDYLELLAAERRVAQCDAGLIWTFPDRLDYEHPAALVRSDTPEGGRLLARLGDHRMPEALVAAGFVDVGEFWAPWCVAISGEEIASIAFSVGLRPVSAEIGLYTFPASRGRGFAAAVTAGWASLPALSGRALFYSTSRSNLSSQRVTERLGLRYIGASLTIS